MTFDEYWRRLSESNPQLEKPGKMTITMESFKHQLRKAFEEGRDSRGYSDKINDMFGGIFGGR